MNINLKFKYYFSWYKAVVYPIYLSADHCAVSLFVFVYKDKTKQVSKRSIITSEIFQHWY